MKISANFHGYADIWFRNDEIEMTTMASETTPSKAVVGVLENMKMVLSVLWCFEYTYFGLPSAYTHAQSHKYTNTHKKW